MESFESSVEQLLLSCDPAELSLLRGIRERASKYRLTRVRALVIATVHESLHEMTPSH